MIVRRVPGMVRLAQPRRGAIILIFANYEHQCNMVHALDLKDSMYSE